MILIYADIGTSEVGVQSLIRACKEKLGYEVKKVYSNDIKNGISSDVEALIIPGGADLPYCKKLNGKGNLEIKKYIENGGNYIGICAGAYYGSAEVEFKGEKYEVNGKRELAFFLGTAKGSLPELTNGKYYDEKSVECKEMVNLIFKKESKIEKYFYQGGSTFIRKNNIDNFEIIATYENGLPAIIKGNVKKGKYLISGVHFELQGNEYKELVLKNSKEKDVEKEEKILNYLNENYGNLIWDEIKKMIKKN